MESSTHSEASVEGLGGEEGLASSFASREELIDFAQTYYASDFRRDDRSECPSPDRLRAKVRSGQLPDEELRAHLFSCSDCFHEYRGALAAHRQAETADATRVTLWQRIAGALKGRLSIPVLVAASLLLLSTAGLFVWRQYRRTPETNIALRETTGDATAVGASNVNESAPPRPSPATDAPPPERPPRDDAPVRRRQPASSRPTRTAPRAQEGSRESSRGDNLIAAAHVVVDLEEHVITRGAEGQADSGKVIKLPRSRRTTMSLTLPEGSEEGWYRVSIVDNSGKALAAARRAARAHGKSLTTVIDTSRLAPQTYRLRVSRRGAVPDFYVIAVEDKGSAPR